MTITQGVQMVSAILLGFLCLGLVAGSPGAPGGGLFAICFIFLLSTLGGNLAVKCHLPALLGMLCVGLLLRNIPGIGPGVGGQVDPQLSSIFRLLALVLILTRAGLAFDLVALQRLMLVVTRLAMLPCLVEACVVFGLAMLSLGFPPIWAAMLGFVVSPISPAVVVPGLLSLQERGYGRKAGIATMVVAAAPLDDVLSIAGFGIFLGLAHGSSGGQVMNFIRAPLELILGLGVGGAGAILLALLAPDPEVNLKEALTNLDYKPSPKEPAQSKDEEEGLAAAASSVEEAGTSLERRLTLLALVSIAAAFGLKLAGFSGASALSILVLSVGLARVWGPSITKVLSAKLAQVWNVLAQPLLFGLVGSAVALDSLDGATIGLGLFILAFSVPLRCMVAFLVVGGRGLTRKERIFTAMAWMPKATVQAAIGGLALDEAVTEDEERRGRQILAVAVLAILTTAPAGAIAIAKLGERLLTKDDEDSQPAKAKKDADADAEMTSPSENLEDGAESASEECEARTPGADQDTQTGLESNQVGITIGQQTQASTSNPHWEELGIQDESAATPNQQATALTHGCCSLWWPGLGPRAAPRLAQ
eukprot:CAMPEP_0206476846 /NCGR_PEP_ID=MMETSP0324_2-20121206/34981_1 /ASSEMBLY_ACC=CAM_ASM_000836 /TAXON_ID=2866 /ORGANISM="Crypthecodinium cohnii, Strain Seligo" /LENGTH=590 /DNA_ID=CAMNT_0053952599 /DNA_START=88 /DNA_END=1860 /DNA_ORIENTATION=-